MIKLETELAIVAAGPAGLCAAVAAAEMGVSVMVFEKSATPGGTANMGMGIFAVESSVQKKHMVNLTKEQAFERFMEYNHWNVDARIVRDYFWKSGDTVSWLEGMGVKFAAPMKNFPDSEPTWHVVQPDDGSPTGARAASSMTRALYKTALELGVQFYLETPVKSLIKEGDSVVGLKAVDKNGEEYEVSAKAVILATGGFGSNPDMVRDYTGYELGSEIMTHMVPGIVGDGVRMGWEAGAMHGRTNMESGALPKIPGMMTGAYGSSIMFNQPRSLMVNKQGFRVCNENILQNTSVGGSIVSYQKDRVCCKIVTDEIVKYYAKNDFDWPSEVFPGDARAFDAEMEDCKANYPGGIFIEETPEALAEAMGIDVKAFLKTIEEYNETCEQNYDDYFCKPRQYLQPMKGKKWYGSFVGMSAYGSLGGLRTNYKYEVLDPEFTAIPGLYAAGTDCCDIYNDIYMYYLPGNTMGFAVNSGRMAGEHAASYILGIEE